MIDPLRLADAIRNQADDYGDKATDTSLGDYTRNMYGSASLVLYGLSVALFESLKPVLHDQAQKAHDETSDGA